VYTIQESLESQGYWSSNLCNARFKYISLASSFDHCTQGGTGDGGDTPPSLGRRSIVDNTDVSSVLTASAKLSDSGGEAVLVLEVLHEVGDLPSLKSVLTGVELVLDG